MKAEHKILAKRYAGAYMALKESFAGGQAGPGAAAVASRITELEKVRNAASQFRKLFLHPLVGHDDKKEILALLLSEDLRISRAAEFTRLLLKENRFDLLDAVIEECMRLYNLHAGIVPSEVASRYPLDKEELHRIEKALSAALGKKALVTQVLCERVIGGLEIKVSDLLIDATIKGRLERLKKGILKI